MDTYTARFMLTIISYYHNLGVVGYGVSVDIARGEWDERRGALGKRELVFVSPN